MRVHILAATLWAVPLLTQAQWTQFTLPNTGSSTAFDHLSDGRFIVNDSGSTVIQDVFGAGAFSTHAATVGGTFPSFIEVKTDNTAVIGPGNFPTGDLFNFNPGVITDTNVSTVGTAIQDYDGALRNNTGLYIAGGNGTGSSPGPFGGPSNAVSHINLGDGSTTLLIDNISTYSAAVAIDSLGDLYVGNNDNGIVRKFTATQLSAGISGGPAMEFSDGSFVHDFGAGGNIASLAVDGQGRLWSAGFLQTGLQVYDPILDESKLIAPGLANQNYSVATFTTGGTDYVSYVNSANGFGAGRAATYGFIDASTIVVPEPSSILLLMLGGFLLTGWRRINPAPQQR